MPTIEISEFESELVLYFKTPQTRINAYTLASTLVNVADAAREANNIVNPGYEIEVVVTALADGSFKAVLKTVFKQLGNLFSKEILKEIIIGIISAYIYEHTLAPNHDVKISVDQQTVVIEQGDTRIIVPKDVYEAKQLVEKSTRFNDSISRTFGSISKDDKIEAFAVTKDVLDEPEVTVSRQTLQAIQALPEDTRSERELVEHAELQILRAILDRTTRKWEFVWDGIKISAPVLDDRFYKQFYQHKITIAPGDSLDCDLRVYQKRSGSAGIFTNYRYEVIKVIRHIPRIESRELFEKPE